ncbi:MAG: helix-turn-helix domain-containing protein [Planctomycetia bacterium]|nr:helix-turn-helix domain-containing protein [Planctomycetia bacterium]
MYYNLEKTAEVLGLTTGDVNRLREQNKLRAFRDGSNWKFRKEEVEQYLTNQIKQRSQNNNQAEFELLNDSDEELPTMLADSSSFDSLIGDNADSFAINPLEDDMMNDPKKSDSESGVSLDKKSGSELSDENENKIMPSDSSNQATNDNKKSDSQSSVSLKKEITDVELLNDSDEELPTMLADSSSFDSLIGSKVDSFQMTSSTDAASDMVLIDENEFNLADDDNIIFEKKSGSDELTLSSDSGIALLDERPDSIFEKSNSSDVDLDAADDFVLGGSSGSNLNLASDSGISLLKSSDDSGFSLENIENDSDDNDIFELAPDTTQASSVIALDDSADTDTATVLGTEEDFMLTPDSVTSQESDSESASQVIDLDNDELFTTSDSESTTYGMISEPEPELISPFQEPFSNSASAMPTDPFGMPAPPMDSLEPENPFADVPSSNVNSASQFDSGPEILNETIVETETVPITPGCSYAAGKGCAQEPNYSGMAICLGLVPCLILLLLSGIGAYELVRTIWSWDQPFGLTGTLLETIGGLFKII